MSSSAKEQRFFITLLHSPCASVCVFVCRPPFSLTSSPSIFITVSLSLALLQSQTQQSSHCKTAGESCFLCYYLYLYIYIHIHTHFDVNVKIIGSCQELIDDFIKSLCTTLYHPSSEYKMILYVLDTFSHHKELLCRTGCVKQPAQLQINWISSYFWGNNSSLLSHPWHLTPRTV